MASAFDPQRLNWFHALFVDRHTVRKVYNFVFGSMNHQNWRCDLGNFIDAGKNIEKPSSFGVGESDSHARHQSGVENNGADFIAAGKIDRRHCAYALTVEYYVLGADSVASSTIEKRLMSHYSSAISLIFIGQLL